MKTIYGARLEEKKLGVEICDIGLCEFTIYHPKIVIKGFVKTNPFYVSLFDKSTRNKF